MPNSLTNFQSRFSIQGRFHGTCTLDPRRLWRSCRWVGTLWISLQYLWNSLNIFGISLKVLPWGWNPPVVASGQCLLPLPHTSLSSLYCIIAQTHISYLTFESPTPPSRNINSLPAASPFPRFVITFCVSLELLQAGTSTVGFSLALITFSLVRWPSSCLFA